jgi:hypothetical protein
MAIVMARRVAGGRVNSGGACGGRRWRQDVASELGALTSQPSPRVPYHLRNSLGEHDAFSCGRLEFGEGHRPFDSETGALLRAAQS